MTTQDFETFLAELEKSEHKILLSKGKEYTIGADDRLANFKTHAKSLGLDPLQVWAIYFSKHIDSIMNYVKERKVHSEPIEGRFMDARNYLALGLALIKDGNGKTKDLSGR